MPEVLDLLRELSLTEALDILRPAATFAIGVAIYAVVVFNLYRFMSRKDIFNLDLSKFEESKFPALSKALHLVFYAAKYLLLFPLFAFAWFGVLVVMVAFLSRSKEVNDLLLIAMAVLSSVRVTSYYTEDLSRDVAKILPFALLGIFLIDLSYFEFDDSLDLLELVGNEWRIIVYYWLFIVALEFVLRISEPYLKALFAGFGTPSPTRPGRQRGNGGLGAAPREAEGDAPEGPQDGEATESTQNGEAPESPLTENTPAADPEKGQGPDPEKAGQC